jgi:ABC-type polysaccharide/polyol phosphate export permease
MIALYFNCFVLVVQSFQKIPFFHSLAPTQKEPPFAVAQAILLILFVGLGIAAFKKFRPTARAPALA